VIILSHYFPNLWKAALRQSAAVKVSGLDWGRMAGASERVREGGEEACDWTGEGREPETASFKKPMNIEPSAAAALHSTERS